MIGALEGVQRGAQGAQSSQSNHDQMFYSSSFLHLISGAYGVAVSAKQCLMVLVGPRKSNVPRYPPSHRT